MTALDLIASAPDDSLLYAGHYDPVLVVLSVAVAIFASYAALLVSQQILEATTPRLRHLWIAIGSLCLGMGIWAMHFVGMLALSLPCTTSYDATVTFLSTIPGILASALAMRMISRQALSGAKLVASGLLVGAGIGAMHYSGMAAMRLDGLIRYDARLFMLSLLVAATLATLALWIRLRLLSWPSRWRAWANPASALVLGLAVSGMHYTAMVATYFVRDGDAAPVPAGLDPSFLAAIVLAATSLFIVVTIVATYLGHRNLSSLGLSYRLTAILVAGWTAVAWLSSNYYYGRRADEAYRQQVDLARLNLDQLARSVERDVQLLKGISRTIARSGESARALHRFGPAAAPSYLAERRRLWSGDRDLRDLGQSLALLAVDLGASEIHVLNAAGDCVASSDDRNGNSFVGSNHADRDYFLLARSGRPGLQFATGRAGELPGLYHSTPVTEKGRFVGAVVVKRNLAGFEPWTGSTGAFLTDSNGVVVLAAAKSMSYRTLPDAAAAGLPAEVLERRYGRRSLQPLRLEPWGDGRFAGAVRIDGAGDPVAIASRALPGDGLTIHVPQSLDELKRLAMEKTWLFSLVLLAGGMLILAVQAIVNAVRDSHARAADLCIAATAFESQEGISITDAAGTILRINRAFTAITGYTPADVIGQTHRLLKSGRQDEAFYREMWRSIVAEGAWQGEIWNRRKNGEPYPEWLSITVVRGPGGQVTNYVGTFTDISRRKVAEDEIRQLAFFDHLTQLPNRRLMLDRLAQALASSARHGRHGALMLIDLDNFKTLNDTLGHAVGDQLLIEAAARLKASVREGDTVARLGGDEFVVILEDLDESAHAAVQAEYVAYKIQSQLARPYQLDITLDADSPGVRNHHCTSSTGISMFLGNAIGVDELMKRADTAMYQAKAGGRNTLCFFDPAMQDAVKSRADMEVDLRKAVFEDQLVLYYQAQVNSAGRVIGAEALVRWKHPERGLVPPGEFIPLAEETGLILPLGHWVLQQACTRLAAWAAQPEKAHLTVAVNVSARQFSLPTLVDEVLALIEHTGAPPHKLKLELTESVLLDNTEGIIAKMLALKEHGVGFAMDDFGTGYSSLSYLKRLPLDQLKIDQSFVRDIISDTNDAAIARTIVALGQSLGLSVIAEGVENEGQRDVLAHSGCHAYQGYFFSRPLPLDAFEDFVARGS